MPVHTVPQKDEVASHTVDSTIAVCATWDRELLRGAAINAARCTRNAFFLLPARRRDISKARARINGIGKTQNRTGFPKKEEARERKSKRVDAVADSVVRPRRHRRARLQ